MKKKLLFVAGLIILSLITNANESDKGKSTSRANNAGGKCFDENTHIINLGFGFGSVGYYRAGIGGGYTYKSSPAMTLTYEQAYPKKLGPGFLGVGALVGFKTASSRYDNYSYQGNKYYFENRWTYTMFTARAVYHWDGLNAHNAEVYGGAILGFGISTYSYKTNGNDPDIDSYKKSGGAYPIFGVFAGARWYFVPKVALFGEAGYGISFINGGLSFKF